MSRYVPRYDVLRCKCDSNLLVNTECEPWECHSCGWNPAVNARRRKELSEYSREGRLSEWGKKQSFAERFTSEENTVKEVASNLVRAEQASTHPVERQTDNLRYIGN